MHAFDYSCNFESFFLAILRYECGDQIYNCMPSDSWLQCSVTLSLIGPECSLFTFYFPRREPSPVDDISLIPVIPEEEPVSTRSLRSKRGPSEEANVTQHNTRRGRKKSYKLW